MPSKAFAAGGPGAGPSRFLGDADLGAELVRRPHLALGKTDDLRRMQGVDLVLVLRRLRQEAFNETKETGEA